MLQDRYLEETIIKKLDRAVHSNDYGRLKDELQMYGAQKRMLQPEIANLTMQYQSAQNSPQAPALKLALNSKLNDLKMTEDKLEIYKDIGRKGLDMQPEEYKLKQARNEGRTSGGLAGLGAGAAGGLVAGAQLFNESDSFSIYDTFYGRVLEEASKTLNPAYSKPIQKSMTSLSNKLPKRWGGDSLRTGALKIGQNRNDLAQAMRKDRNRSGTDTVDPLGRAAASAKSILTDPKATKKDHPVFETMKKTMTEPHINKEIRDQAPLKKDQRKGRDLNRQVMFGSDTNRKSDALAAGVEKGFEKAKPYIKDAGVLAKGAAAAGAAAAGPTIVKAGNAAMKATDKVMDKAKPYINQGVNSAKAFQQSAINNGLQSAIKSNPGGAGLAGAGALGAAGLGMGALNMMFGDGDSEIEPGEVEPTAELPVAPIAKPETDIYANFPGGKTGLYGAGGAAAGLAAHSLGKKLFK